MKNDYPWVNEINKETFYINKPNPQDENKALQDYLSFYKFDLSFIDEYRCGTVDSHHRKVFTQAFLKKNSKGTVFFVHGYLDHSAGLSSTVNHLLSSGYEVVMIDLPGHGFSQGESGTIATFDEYVHAIEKGYEFIKDTCKNSNFIGLGHSMGGAVLFHAVSEKKVCFDQLILVAPLYHPYKWNLVKGTLKMFGKFIPRKKRRFKRNSDDRDYRNFIKRDPLQVRWLKSDWVLAMEDWQAYILNCPILHIPVYFLQGDKDKTVDWKKNVGFYKQKCKQIQIAFFPSGRHQLLNEQEEIRRLVHERITSFLDKN